MSIRIIQNCNRRGAHRELNVGYHGGLPTIKAAARTGGWRDVEEFKHLCPTCIRAVLSATEEPS